MRHNVLFHHQSIQDSNRQSLEIQLMFFLICVFPPRFAALIADAESAMTASADRLVELDTMIAEAQANRTDEHTTIAEILERHPDIAAEIEEEIKEDKWFAQ